MLGIRVEDWEQAVSELVPTGLVSRLLRRTEELAIERNIAASKQREYLGDVSGNCASHRPLSER
jgi:hypothetical protein